MALHECLVCSDTIDTVTDNFRAWFEENPSPISTAQGIRAGELFTLRSVPDGYTHAHCTGNIFETAREVHACPRCKYTRSIKVSYVTRLQNGEIVRTEFAETSQKLCTACALDLRARELADKSFEFVRKADAARARQEKRKP